MKMESMVMVKENEKEPLSTTLDQSDTTTTSFPWFKHPQISTLPKKNTSSSPINKKNNKETSLPTTTTSSSISSTAPLPTFIDGLEDEEPPWSHPSDDIFYQGLEVFPASKLPMVSELAHQTCLAFRVAYNNCKNHQKDSISNQELSCIDWLTLHSRCTSDYKYILKRMGYEEIDLTDSKRKYMIHQTDRILRESWKREKKSQEVIDDIYNPLI